LDIGRHVGDDQPFYGLDLPAEIMRGPDQLVFSEVAQRALAAMRRIQPRGPYLIGGHCFGAVVAFGVVNHLEAAGEEVELLVLMDPPNPPQCEAQQRLSERLHYHVRNLLRRGPLAQIRYLGERLRNISKRLRASGDDDDAELYRDFSPSIYSGRLLMLLAKDTFHSMHPEHDPRLMWRHWAREGIESVELPGDHVTFCREPLVQHTGLALRAFIDRAISRAVEMGTD
jgi:thioesterase domain-containing protein